MIKIFKTKFNKLIALLTTTSLLISFVVGPTAASAINNDQTAKEYSQIFKEFILPYSYGKITKSHFAGTDRVIINIQDLHCHPKVQKNIANIIETFDNKYGVNNIYLEGAYGDVSTKWITDQIKKDNNLLEKMMDTGRLTGAEYYSALSGKTEIIKGLEEKEPYLDNITRLGSILDSQEKIDLILKSLDESVNEVKKKYYTKRQYKIEHLFKEYKDGKINSQKYYALLSKHIDKLGIDLTKYENTLIYVTLLNSQKDLNYKQITKELQSLISILKQQLPYNAYRALLENTSNFQEVEKLYSYIIQLDKVYNLDISLKFTELDKYFKYIELSKKINPVELVKEDEFLSQEINTRFSQTSAQKDVVFLVHFGRYLRDYVTTKITLEDYKYYKENIEQYRKIYNKYVDNRVLSLLDEYIAQIDKFYEINMDRNLYFTKNMFEENEQFVQIEQVKQAFDDINKIISNMDEVKRVDVVVTGGFHSQTVTELLEQQNVSYIVITPNVTDGIKLAEETYYELAKEQSKISFQTIAPLIASLSPQLQAILLNKIESEDTEKIEQIMKMDEAERAQTIADLAAAKLLESDDLGNLKETLNEIVKNLVDEYHKEKVTSELVSEIKNLQSLLKNKENLQKVIDLLSEGTVKQSVILVSDMFDDIYEQLFGIFPSFADKDKLEPRDAKSPRKYFEEDIEKYSIYKIQDEDYYGYDIFDSLDIWFSDEELILSREIIEQSNFNEDLERFIGYLGQNNIADYELLNKILTVLKSINEEDRKNGFCGILHAVIDEGTNKIDKEQALKAKEKILSFLETPTQLQFEICDLFSIVDLDYNENTEKTFFDALLDVINKDGYKNIDIDFLFEVVDNSRLIAELETRENLYDFLTLSIEKRRLIYNFYKSSENNFDIGINQLTLNFIISVLNKYNFTDEQFNYIMELICSINLKDDKDGKAYIDNLKDKEINLLVLDQVRYLRIYNRYMMNLIFSDIDRKNIQIIIPNLQKIIELFDGLQKYQIDTLETENKGFALVLFSSVKFKEYCEKNKITDITKQYQLAIRISRRIHSITGDKFFTLSYTKTEKIIERTLKYYDTIKQIVSILTLFTNKTAVFSLHNGERNDDGSGFRFTPAGLKKVLEILDIKPEIFEVIEISFLDKVLDFIKGIEQDEIDTQTLLDFVNSLDGSVIVKNGIIKDLSHKKKISKNEFIEHLNSLKSTEYFVEVNRLLRVIEHFNEYKQDKGVFIFDGHGHDESFSYSENGALTVKQISKALINAYNNGVDLKNITLMFESCHSYDFADNIINELRANGITSFPQIITDAGRETIYGYTNSIDIDGTTIRVSNLFYSLLKFLKLKTEEELKQMKGRLTFKDIADAPRYLSNNTMFVTNQQVMEENSKLEADIIDIINEQDAEDIETVTAKNDIAYAGTYKVYSELTTWLSKLILKIRGLDAKSVEGQDLINRLENWQILLGIFFPAIKNMFVGMHGEENREGVEQGLASVLDRIGDAFKSAVNVTIEEASGLSFAKKLTNFVIALQNPDLMKELAEAHKEWNLGVQTGLLNVDTEEIVIEGSKEERESIIEEIKRITGLDSNVQEDAMILSYLTNTDFYLLNNLFSMIKDNIQFQNKDSVIKLVHISLIASLMSLQVIDFDEARSCLERIYPVPVENSNDNNNKRIYNPEERALIVFLTNKENIRTIIDILDEAKELKDSDESTGLGVIIRDMLEKIASNTEDEDLFPLFFKVDDFIIDFENFNKDDINKINKNEKKERSISVTKTFLFRLCAAINREVKLSLSDYSYIKDLLHHFKKNDLFGNQYESFVEFCKLKDGSKRKIVKYIKDNCGTKPQSIGLAFEVMVKQAKKYEDGQYSEEEIDFVLELITSIVPSVTIGEENRDFLIGEFNAILNFISNRSLNKKVFEFVSRQGKGKHRSFLLQIAFLNIDFDMEDVKHLIELGDKLFNERIILFNINDSIEELAIRIFLNSKIQEMNESALLKFRIAQKMARTLYHVVGENVLDITDEQLNLIMDKLIEDSVEKRGVANTINLFSEKTGTVSIHNKEEDSNGNRRFTSKGLEKIFSLLGIEPGLKTDFVIDDHADMENKKRLWLDSIENFLELLEENELSNIMFIFDGHGSEGGLHLLGNGETENAEDVVISVEDVAQALFRAYKKCVDHGEADKFEKLILNLSSCHSYVFARRVIDRLSELEQQSGYPLRLPQIITEAGKETKFGFSATYKNSETGENFQLGNLEYSVIRFLENKIKNGEDPKSVTLQDLFDSEIYRSNHTIFLSNSKIEELNENLEQYVRNVIGKGNQDKKQNIKKAEINISEDKNNLEKNQQNQNMFDSSFGMLSKALNLILNVIRTITDPTILLRKIFPKNTKIDFIEKFVEKKLADKIVNLYDEESVDINNEKSVDDKQRFPRRATELTTWLSKLILKIRGLDAKSVEGQDLINRLENWQILLGIFFPPIKNMFVGMHGEENREGVEQGLASVLDRIGDAFKSAVNVTIEEASGLSFAKKLTNFVIALQNPDLMKELADAHKEWNLGVQRDLSKAEDEEIIVEESEQERQKIVGENEQEQFVSQQKWTMSNISKEAPYTEKYKLVYYIFEKTCRQMDIEFPEEQEFIIINNIIDAYDSSFWKIMDFENWVYEHFITDIIDFQLKQSRLTDALSKCFPDDIEDILWIFSQCLSKSKVPMFILNNIIDVANDLEKINNIHFSEEVYAVLNILKRYNTSETEQILVNIGLIKVPNALYKKAMDDIEFKKLEEEIIENENRKTIILSEMMLPSTQKALNKIGNIGIIKAVYKEKSGENFRFTTLGVALGVLIETFKFWRPDFIKSHNFDPSIQAGMTAVVWAVRALSIGIGIWTGSILAVFLAETITHFIWNIGVIVIGRQDLLLQTSKEKSNISVIVPSVEEKKQARELTQEEEKKLEETLTRTKVRIKNSTLEITEENNKNLAMELQTIFDSLLDSMVDMGKISESDKKEYELILYLSDEVNAFTVSGSKTVFISTGMLNSFSTYLNGKIGKEHVAAILAHELEHTVQDKRVYRDFISGKGDQKKDEYDSDIQAIFILDNAGYNPISVQDLMEYLAYLEEKTRYVSIGLNKILDAHPDAQNRLVKIKTFLSDRNIFLRSTSNSIVSLENGIPYYGETDMRSDIHVELGYYEKGVGPRDSNGFITKILKKYGDKITLYKILDIFNDINRFVDVNEILNYINSVEYPFFNDKIKNLSDNQKKVIFRLMNSFDGHYPSNAEIYKLCPDMNELKEVFDFIIEPGNYFFFFSKISFLNISYLVAALYNSGNLGEKDYDKIQKFLSMNEDSVAGFSTFYAAIDKDTVDFYIDKFELFDNSEKYKLYSEFRDAFSKEKDFSDKQKEKLRKFFLTPSQGGTGAYHMFRGSDFFGLLYPEMTLKDYIESITEEQKQKILEDAEKNEIEKYNSFTRARNREVLGDAYDPAKESPGVTSMYEIYRKSGFAYKKFEKSGNKWEGEKKYQEWLSKNDDALFAEWLENKKAEWFFDEVSEQYRYLMFERFESELLSKLNTLEEKLYFLFPGGLMELGNRFSSLMDYETSIPKILKKDIENIKNTKELFALIDAVINYFDKENLMKKRDLSKTVYVILSNIDRSIVNNFTIEDIQKLFELSILKGMSDVTNLLTVSLIIKRKNPKSILDFGKIFSMCDYKSKERHKETSDFVQNVMDEEQLAFLLKICYEKNLDLRDILPLHVYDKLLERFDENFSLEEKYRYSIYKDKVYPYNVHQKIKNEEELKDIPIEHLKRFLGIEIPIHKDYFMNHSMGRIGIEDSFALRILQNKVEQYQQNFGKSFYDVKNFNEFAEKVKGIEDVFYPWSNKSADNGNEIFSNEVDMVWANLLHNMCGFGLETKSFVFVNIHGEELLNVWCELEPNYDFVPNTQQTNELLSAFVLIKKYLPKEQSVAYARMLYEMIGKNKTLSVFESVEKNLELLDFFFEGFSEIKDDYIYELLENYDIDINTYNECLSKTTYYAYKDETENTGKNFLYRELATVLSNGGMTVENKIKFIAWLISDKQEKPEFLKNITVKNDYEGDPNHNRTSLGEDAKVDIFRNYFWSMTRSERTEYIRELLTDILRDGTDGKGQDYEILKNTLADAFFDSMRNNDNEKIVDALKMSFKIILDSLASHENKSTSERQILFISDLIDSLVSMSKSNFSPEEKEARQIGKFIVAMGSASGVAVVKILQILSNSKAFDGLGKQGFIINEEISKVRSSNEQLSKRVVFQQLENLGMLESVKSVGKCLGSASIGVTYLINMKDGSKRIIKIKRPSVLKNYEQDLVIAERLIDFFKFFDILPQSNKNMIPTIGFLEQVFNTELNFEDEVDNLLRAKANLSQTAINTPDIVGNYNVDSFMQTMASGQSFDNAKSIYSEQERAEIYSKILLEFFREVFMDGFFHADLHEGNIFVDKNKDITFIDWGACGYVEESKRDDLETVFVSLLLSDSDNFMEALKKYDIGLYEKTSPKSKEIVEILNSNDSLESKFGRIFTIFNQIDMSRNHDFLMFIQGLSKIAKYIDNLSAKEKIVLLLDDTVIYDLLQNKQVLANIYGLLEKTFPDKYGKIIKFALTKLVKSNEESLRDVITNLKLFILNFDDDAVLRRLISSILKALSLPSVFENQLKVLISKKIKQLSDMSDLYSQRNRGAVKEEKGSRFKVLAFIKERFFKEAVIQQDKIEFSKESEPVVFLIQKDGVQYSLTLELNYVYRDDNDKNYIDVGIKDEKLIAYLSTIGKEAFSKETSKYTSIDSIEELLGIKINVSGKTVSVTSENAQTDIKYIRYEDIPKIISDLKGQPIESFQEKEAELLKNDSGCNGVENLFLDQDIQAIKTKIDSAIKDNKSKVLFALYPFSKDYDIASLSDKQKLALYLQISKSFEDIARTLLSEEYFYRIDNEEINALKYSTLELIQKAFFAGNASLSKPIYLSCDYYGGTPTFTVYRKLGDETIDEKQRNLAAVVNKRSEWAKTAQYYQEKKLLTTTPQERTIRRIGEEKYYASKIEKAFRRYYESESLFSFDDDFGLSVELEDFEDLFEEGEESSYIEDKETSSAIEDEKTKREVDFLSVQEILDAFGNNGIIKRIYKNNAGENFKFTTTGVIFGAVIELIPFFMPNFINGHHFDSSVKSGMTAVVWVIRALTIGIGCVTWSVPIAVISNIILHSVWNRVVILLGKQHLMLMLNKNSVETYLKDKGLDTKKIDNLEEQIDFLLNILRGELDVYVNYRSFQYFSLKKETRKHIFDLLQDSNVDRFFFGRFIYAMEMAEENGFTDNEIIELIKFLKNHQDLASFVGDEADKSFFYKTVVTLKEKKINITEDVYLQIMFLSPLKNTSSIVNFFNLKEENRQAIYDIFKDNDYFKYFANNIIWLVEKLETDNFSKEMIGKILQITANVTDTSVLRNRQKIELLIKMADWLIHENYDIGDSKYIQFIVSCLSDFDNTSVDIETLLQKDSEELNGLFGELFGQFEIEFEKEEEVITIMVRKDGKQYSINFYVKDGDVTLFSIDNDIVYYLERYKRYGPRELFSFIGIGIHPSKNKLTVVTSDKATDVKFIKHTDDGKVVSSSQNQVVIESENEQALVNGTHSEGIERIFLDKLPENGDGISDAIGKNKLFAIYPVSQSYDIDSLTDEDLVVLFRTINQNIFKLAQKFPKIDFYTRATKENRFDFVMREFVKNAFVHGNLSDPSKPIYIKFDGDKITVYNAVTDDADTTVGKENRERRLNLSTIAELSGVHKGISNIRDLERDGLITVEQESELRIGTQKYFVISAEKTKSKKTSSTLLLPSTQQTLGNLGENSVNEEIEEKQQEETDITVVQAELPESYLNLTDDYNQFEHMEMLPNFAKTDTEEDKRQSTIQLFNEQIEDISSKTYQFVFEGNTKYLYLLQNRNNRHVLLNIVSQPNVDLKFRLFALLYLDKLRNELTPEERDLREQNEKSIVKQLKKQIGNNEFKVLNNLDLRAYMMGVYLMLRDYSEEISVPNIIDRAIIINPSDGIMARDDGLFAGVDLFIVIHELTHLMFYKPKDNYKYVDDALDELVSYIVPNFFLRKIINLSLEAYSESQNLYTIHQTDGVIDYIKMGRKFHSLYSMFDKVADEYEFKQEEHSAPIAFLDYLFKAHQKIGKPVNWDVLLDVIENLSLSKLEQIQMFRRLLKLYMKRSVDEGLLTSEEAENMKKDIEEMQSWTLLVKEIIETIEGVSPDVFNLLKGVKDAKEYKEEILSETNKAKENFDKFLRAYQTKFQFSKSDLIVMLIIDTLKNVEYEQLENNFDGVIAGIIDVINKAGENFSIDLNRQTFDRSDYLKLSAFVKSSFVVAENKGTSIKDNIIAYISRNLGQVLFVEQLINKIFGAKDLSSVFGNRKVLVTRSAEQTNRLNQILNGINDTTVVTMEIIKSPTTDIRDGIYLDVVKGIKAKYDKDTNTITVYSKKGVADTENIEELIMKQYFSERKEDSFDDVIAFADTNTRSIQDITEKLNNAYTDSVSIPNKETTFDLSSRGTIKNIINVCEQESRATGIKTFIITFDQAQAFYKQIQELQERDFKFIVSCKIDAILEINYYDGLIIDDSKTDYEDISQLSALMEKVKKSVLKTGVAKPVSVKFSNNTYGKFNSAGINIFDTYGILPIVEDSYMTNSIIGKFVVDKIRENNMERFLRQNNVVGFVIDNSRAFVEKKSKLRELFSKEHKYNKGYNAALSSKFDYTCADVKILANYLDIEIVDNKASEKTDEQKLYKQKLDKQKLEELKRILSLYGQNSREEFSSELLKILSFDSKAYLKYLADKNRDEELLGFIRGIAMNSARTQVFKGLEEKGFNLDMKKFANVADGKYQKAFLTIAVQLMMEDIDITELLETDFIDSDMTAKEYLDSILEKVNINIEEILKQNEYKIEKIEKEDIPKTIEDFKNYVVLLDNLKIIKDTTVGLDMSIKAVRSILSAA